MPDIDLFMKLFKGRTDCYGQNQACIKEALTKDIIKKHLDGIQRIGIYPLFDKKWTNWFACDIDAITDNFNIALSIKERAEHYKLKMYIERSKSKGFHVYCFFDKPIEAVKPRLLFEMILEELQIKCEIFPKQDETTEDRPFGNFIFLPLFGGDTRNERTIFVTDENKVFIDSIKDLKKIQRTKVEDIEEAIKVNNLERKQVVFQEAQITTPSFSFSRSLPCIEKIKLGVPKGYRDNCCFRLVINLKEKGMSRDDIQVLINNWNLKNEEPLSEKQLIKIIESVFKGNYKSYGCDDAIILNYCDKEKCPLTESQKRKEQIEQGIITMTFRDTEVMVFKKKEYEYRLSGFEFTKSGKFKMSMTLSKAGKFLYKDLIKLDIASNRMRFVKAAKDEEVENDLIKIDDLVKKQLEKEEHDKLLIPKQLYVMTEEEKNDAMKFLNSTPHILYKVVDITNKMGLVGEETLRLMVYLCYTSRLLNEPLSMTVKGEASSGKSFTCQNVQKLIPEEGYHFITRATQNAFFHLPEDGMQHRIIYINEIQGSESADYSIRTAQSEGDLILMLPIKDQATGNIETITKRVRGPVGFLITTTKAHMFDENETRNFSLFSDDSPQLTREIGSITSRRAMGEEFNIDEREKNLWKNMQRLLNPDFKVIIPYAKEVFDSFPDKPVRIRRDRERFRVLLEIVTILHQFHRKQEKIKEDRVHLISTLADYFITKRIVESVLTYTIYETGPSAEELWKAIKAMNERWMMNEHEEMFTFKYKDVAEQLDWKVEKVKKWTYSLIQAGLVDYSERSTGGKGKASIFKISKQGLEWSSESLSFLPKVEELYSKYPCDKELFYDPVSGKKINPVDSEVPEGLLE